MNFGRDLVAALWIVFFYLSLIFVLVIFQPSNGTVTDAMVLDLNCESAVITIKGFSLVASLDATVYGSTQSVCAGLEVGDGCDFRYDIVDGKKTIVEAICTKEVKIVR